jgi:hypothetical protein
MISTLALEYPTLAILRTAGTESAGWEAGGFRAIMGEVGAPGRQWVGAAGIGLEGRPAAGRGVRMMSRRRIWNVPGLILLAWALVACAGGYEEAVITKVMTEPSEPEPAEVTMTATAQPTPAPTAAAMVTPAPDPAALIQAEFARLEAGHVLYNPPEEMQVGRRERVEVRIAQGVTETLAAESLQGSGEPVVEAVPVSAFMKVRLTGDAFTITPLSSEEQFLVADTFTEWAWDVVPEEAGDQRLTLLITARVLVAGYPAEQRDLRIIEREIDVRVKPLGPAAADFLREHLELVITVVVVPLLAVMGRWIWPRMRNREK